MTAEQAMLARCATTERIGYDRDRADAAMHTQMSEMRGDREGQGSAHPQPTVLAATSGSPGTGLRNLLDWYKFDAERSRDRLSKRACQRMEGR